MRRTTLLLLLALAACAALPASAHAAGTLTVQKNVARGGSVAAGGKIDCGTSCESASAFFSNVCAEGVCEPPEVFVFATPQSGWSAAYSGCSDGGEETCSVILTSSRQVTVTFTDVEDPEVSINSPAAGSAVRGSVTVGATATDNDSVARVEFYANGAKIGEDSTSPYSLAVNTAALADGSRALSVKAFDASGNASAAASRSVVVDNTKPAVNITGGPAAGALIGAPGDVAYALQGSDATSGVTQMQCGLDGGTIVTCDSKTAHAFTAVAEGSQKFLVRAVDAAGNASDWAQRAFTVDTTAPSLSFTGGPADGAIVGPPANLAYTFSAADANGVSVTCGVGGAFGACSSAAGHALSGLADGVHTIALKATDGAGNQRVVTREARIDTTAPTITITSGPAEGAVLTSAFAQFHWMIDDASPGFGSLECAEDGGSYGSCDSLFSHDMWGIADGPHSFALRGVDSAGNVTTVSRSFRVDTTAPETTVDGFENGVLSFSASEAATFACRIYAAGATPPAFGDCSGTGEHATGSLEPGDYVFEVAATDAAGHVDQTPAKRAFTVTAETVPPRTGDDTTQPPVVTGTPGGGEVAAPQPQTQAPVGDKPAYTARFKRAGKRARVAKLLLTGVPAGAAIEVSCKGKGCAFKKKKAAGTDLTPLFKRRALAPGARIEVRVAGVRLVTFTIRPKGKAIERAG